MFLPERRPSVSRRLTHSGAMRASGRSASTPKVGLSVALYTFSREGGRQDGRQGVAVKRRSQVRLRLDDAYFEGRRDSRIRSQKSGRSGTPSLGGPPISKCPARHGALLTDFRATPMRQRYVEQANAAPGSGLSGNRPEFAHGGAWSVLHGGLVGGVVEGGGRRITRGARLACSRFRTAPTQIPRGQNLVWPRELNFCVWSKFNPGGRLLCAALANFGALRANIR